MNQDIQSTQENTNEIKQDKVQPHYLWWINQKSGKRHSAGVGFYSEKYGEFRLKLDCFPQNQFYLKVIGSEENKVEYRAEIVQKRHGKFIGRRPVGVGYSNPELGKEIHIELGPFTNTLALDL